VARVYLQLGIIASARRNSADAAEAFRRALCLDGDMALDKSAGPHVAETFARVKSALPPAAAFVPVITLGAVSGRGELSVEAAPKPSAGPARRVSVRMADLREERDLGADPIRFSLPLPGSIKGCVTATAAVLDEFGNELWPAVASQDVCRSPPEPPLASASKPLRPSALAAPSPSVPASDVLSKKMPPSPAPRPIPRAVWVVAAMTGAAAVGTAVLGMVALERGDDYNDRLGGTATYDQQRQLRELAVTAQKRATAGAIVTGVLSVATVVLYLRGRF
jgi:hypothetical protein